MCLAKCSVEIGFGRERMNAHHHVDAFVAHKGQVGKVAVVKFDPYFVFFGELARVVELRRVGIDGNYFRTSFGHGDRAVSHPGAEFEHPLVGDVAEQTAIEASRQIRTEFDVIGGTVAATRK